MARPGNFRPLLTAGILLGAAAGALAENIVFREVFRTHAFVRGTENSTFWSGCFQALALAVLLFGLRLLWRAGRRPDVPWRGWAFAGSLLLGWGTYTCAEGMLFHEVFGLHHLVESAGSPWRIYWDIAYITAGAVAVGLGGEVVRQDYQAFLHRRRQWKMGARSVNPVHSANPLGPVRPVPVVAAVVSAPNGGNGDAPLL